MTHFFEGLVTELITAFNPDGSIDYQMTGDLVDFQIQNGVTHFFVNGLGAESHELSFEEQRNVLKTVVDRCKNGEKTMACCFVASVTEGKQLMDLYADIKYDALCFTAPPLFHYTDEALYAYTSELINYTEKPCYIYNCMQMPTYYSADLLARLVKDHKNLRGFKNAARDIVHFMQCLMRIDAATFDFLDGCDATIGATMLLGACGCVSFMGVPFPKETKAICDYALQGDYKKTMEAQFKILELRNILKQSPFNAAYMYAQELTGGPVAKYSRMPAEMTYVSEDVKKQLQEAYARMQQN